MAYKRHENQNFVFSVILISYRHEDFIADAIKSIKFQDYDYSKYELIIICRSSSAIRAIIGDLDLECNVRFIISDDYRIGPKFLEALKMAQSQWIAVIDDDDMWVPKKLKELEELISQYPDLIYIHNGKYIVDEDFHYTNTSSLREERLISPSSKNERSIMKDFRKNCEHNESSIAFSKTIVNGKLDSLALLEGALDTFLFVSAIEYGGKIICLNEKLTFFRVTSKNNQSEYAKNQLNNLKRQLQSYIVIRNMKLTNHFTQWFIDWRIMYNRLKINLMEDTKTRRRDRFEFLLESIRNKFFKSREGLYFEFLFVLQFISERASRYIYKLAIKALSR